MVAPQRVGAVAPRHAKTCHHRAWIGAVLVGLEHYRGQQRGIPERIVWPRQLQPHAPVVPALQKFAA